MTAQPLSFNRRHLGYHPAGTLRQRFDQANDIDGSSSEVGAPQRDRRCRKCNARSAARKLMLQILRWAPVDDPWTEAWRQGIDASFRAAQPACIFNTNSCIFYAQKRIKSCGLYSRPSPCKERGGLYEKSMQTLAFHANMAAFLLDSSASTRPRSCKPLNFLQARQQKCKPLRFLHLLRGKQRSLHEQEFYRTGSS